MVKAKKAMSILSKGCFDAAKKPCRPGEKMTAKPVSCCCGCKQLVLGIPPKCDLCGGKMKEMNEKVYLSDDRKELFIPEKLDKQWQRFEDSSLQR